MVGSGFSRPSMWRKAQEKKSTNKYHSRNFEAGHVTPSEHYLERTGLRGRKRWIFFGLLIFIYLIVIGHLFLTSVILSVLRFSERGPSYFVFKDNGALLWPEGAELEDVGVASFVRAYRNESLVISGQAQSVRLRGGVGVQDQTSEVMVSQSSVKFSPSTSMFITGHSGQQLLSVNASHVVFDSPPNLGTLMSTRLTTNAVLGGGGDLKMVADQMLTLRGTSGLSMGGSHMNVTGTSDISFSAGEERISLEAQGIILQGLPTVTVPSPPQPSSGASYHVCACASGRLFRVPVNPLRCAGASTTPNPCT